MTKWRVLMLWLTGRSGMQEASIRRGMLQENAKKTRRVFSFSLEYRNRSVKVIEYQSCGKLLEAVHVDAS